MRHESVRSRIRWTGRTVAVAGALALAGCNRCRSCRRPARRPVRREYAIFKSNYFAPPPGKSNGVARRASIKAS